MDLLRKQTIDSIIEEKDREITEGTKRYSFKDILSKLDLINAGILVATRGGSKPIQKSLLINPYSSMFMNPDDGDEYYIRSHKRYVLDVASKPKFIPTIIRTVVHEFIERNFAYFEAVLPGITRKNLYEVIYEHKHKSYKVRESRRLSRNYAVHAMDGHKLAFNMNKPNRLYPLNNERYNEFAAKCYSKLGQPKLKKRFIDGVRFGAPKINPYTVSVTTQEAKIMKVTGIDARYLGMQLITTYDNKIKIGFTTEDGIWTCIHRNNKGGLWELTVALKPYLKYATSVKQVIHQRYFGKGKFKLLKGVDLSHVCHIKEQ